MTKIKIAIKNRFTGSIIFEYEKENNTVRNTVIEAIDKKANLSNANLSRADLRWANLSEADLSEADLRWANLSRADLRWANLSEADLRWANLSEANLSKADLRWADLSEANLSKANLSRVDLSEANLSKADLSEANLSKADLSEADLKIIKHDFWAKLFILKNEIPAFKEKLIAGEINGSCYDGECACFVGTFANIKKIHYEKLEGVYPDSESPTERWFLGISQGDTPKKSQIAKITLEWIEEFQLYLNKK